MISIKSILVFIWIPLLYISCPKFCFPKDNDDSTQQTLPKIGNFALPASQQPGPLVLNGFNIVDKDTAQLINYFEDYQWKNKYSIKIYPSILYGINDNFSILLTNTYALDLKDSQTHSKGLGDSSIQLEYAIYNYNNKCYQDMLSIITNISIPFGSSNKIPATGNGSLSYLLGGTYSRIFVDWFLFVSLDAEFTTTHNGTKFGNEYSYGACIGRNICNIGKDWIIAWMLEGNGEYIEKDKIKSILNNNSGGNSILLIPSLWASSKKCIFQLGIGFPVVQSLFGNQQKKHYLLACDFTWTF